MLSDKISEIEKDNFNSILKGTATQAKFEYSLKHLSEYLYKHHEQEVIILVDEYDAPIINAFNNTNKPIKSPDKENKTYYEKVISFMQTFLGKAYKGNRYLKKGLLTGVMRVGKESIFSEWNNFSVFGITSPYFAENFGFTEQETQKIITDFGLQKEQNNIRKWYNGYKFGDKNNIYNPWSIVNFISRNKEGFKPYWVNSGDYSLIKSRIIELGVKENIQTLIEGKTIEKELHDNFVFHDFETDNELLWTLLTDNGYLTQLEESDFSNHKLRIPNYEVKIVFANIIKTWLNNEIKLKKDLLVRTTRDLINNNIEHFEAGFKQITGDTLSYFDTKEKSDKQRNEKTVTYEQVFHIYTLGLLAILSDDYIIKSNRESGEGRYDIMLIPYDKTKNGVVLEIKSIKKQNEKEERKDFIKRINNEINKALNQIEKNRYYTELIENNVKPENIIKLSIVFAGEEPYINKITEE